MSQPFTSHDEVTYTGTSALLGRLCQEWVHLNQLTANSTALTHWGRTHDALAGFTRPGDIVDALQPSGGGDKDAILTALLRLAQDGQQLAGRVILQTMLPKLERLVRSTGGSGTSEDRWIEDRRHIAVAELWSVISTYPRARTHNVAGGLALDTLHRLTEPRRAQRIEEVPVTPEAHIYDVGNDLDAHGNVVELHALAFPGQIHPDISLDELLNWASDRGVVGVEDGALLRSVYLEGSNSQDLARSLNISPAAIRQRCSRARRRLEQAVTIYQEAEAS